MATTVKKSFQPYLYNIQDEEILEIFAISQRNCFGLWKNSDECFGIALYPKSSFINHSCYPNCVRIQNGSSISMIVIRPIEIGDEISISYIDTHLSVFPRKLLLKANYCFDCQCQRCSTSIQTDSDHQELKEQIELTIKSYQCKNPKISCTGILYFINNGDYRICNFCKWKEQ
eukprot:gene4563-5686_t